VKKLLAAAKKQVKVKVEVKKIKKQITGVPD